MDQVELKKIRNITFINARDIMDMIYTSKSGNTKLRWRQIRGRIGRVTGEVSANSLGNLVLARVLFTEDVERIMGSQQQAESDSDATGTEPISPGPEAPENQD